MIILVEILSFVTIEYVFLLNFLITVILKLYSYSFNQINHFFKNGKCNICQKNNREGLIKNVAHLFGHNSELLDYRFK